MKHEFGSRIQDRAVEFTVWAPAAESVAVVYGERLSQSAELTRLEDGVFGGSVPGLKAGARYKYRIDDRECPDPYSRYQPEGPHGPSMVVDSRSYIWSDEEWRGVSIKGQVLYELHIGTFTEAGTFDAAAEKLEYLRSVGVTLIEIMPVAEFPGRWNWGYDGVCLFAPFHDYGDYNAFKRFVDRAHRLGLGVILDVVYNHIGPDGNYLSQLSPWYFSTVHKNDWGTPFNLDGAKSHFVREYILDNACEWIREFHCDGLRLDATSNIPDDSVPHIVKELCERTRVAAGKRQIVLIAEDEQQQAGRLRDSKHPGLGLDAMWNDDFHHTAFVALTGRRQAYYYDYKGSPQEFISSVKRGFLFQGQYYHWQKKRRGEPLRTAAPSCVIFLENHDQVANSLRGARRSAFTSRARYRAMMGLLLLSPQTPLLFMGQEFDASTPFLFFADHAGDLRDAVRKGRSAFLSQFTSMRTSDAQAFLDDPAEPAVFRRSKLNWREQADHSEALQLTRDLLVLRKRDPVIREQDATRIDGAVLADHAFVLRWFDEEQGDRLLLMNLGVDHWLEPGPEPLLAPSAGKKWTLSWSSERVEYGGAGAEHPETDRGWYAPSESAILLCESTGDGK